jgi:hypothetical protein
MESKALALGKQVKAKVLNSNVHLLSITLYSISRLYKVHDRTTNHPPAPSLFKEGIKGWLVTMSCVRKTSKS